MSQEELYPVATEDGAQIRLDVVKPQKLTAIQFLAASATVQDTGVLALDKVYILYSTQDCLIDFTALATITPVDASAVLLLANERGYIIPPEALVGLSVIGLTLDGTLFVQEITRWAGLTIPSPYR